MSNDDWRLLAEAIIAVGALATAGTFLVIIFQLRTMKESVRDAKTQLEIMQRSFMDTRTWNKMSMAFQLMPSHTHINAIEHKLNESFLKLIERSDPISPEEVNRLFSEEEGEVRLLLKNYLNELESYCVAINMGIVDEQAAERQFSYKIKRYFTKLRPYIERMRVTFEDARIYIELENVARRWLYPERENHIY